jgi:recombinational DNA repair protein (RecF pathway)
VTPSLSAMDRARSILHPVHCALCARVAGHTYTPASQPFICHGCTSCHPRPRWGNMLGAAQLLVFALRPENLFLAQNLVAAALAQQKMWRETRQPFSDLSDLKITLNF